jgi:putative nucleotidyltransferase with HDIG domain
MGESATIIAKLSQRLSRNSGQHVAILSLYAIALGIIAMLTQFTLFALGFSIGDPIVVAGLCVVAAVGERGTVRLGTTTEQSISLLPTLFAAVTFGPTAAALVGAASMLGDPELFTSSSSRSPVLKFTVYSSSRALVGSAAGLSAIACEHLVPDFGGIALAATIAALVAEALDVGFAALTAYVRNTRSFVAVVRTHAPLVLTSTLIFAPVVAVLAIAYDVSRWTALVFFAPALAAQQVFGLYQEQKRLNDELSSANLTLRRANLSFAEALVTVLEESDLYTAGHSKAVAIYSRDIAKRMGLPMDTQEQAYLCGLVHDIGKIGLPASLLSKDGPLTLEERRMMERHSEIGERILDKVDAYGEVAKVVRSHHERIDGEGYPDGLDADEIPLLSRIIAVADAYNAMTSNRPYRDAMPSRVARLRLAQAVESQFDTHAVAAFEALLAGCGEDYRTAARDEFKTDLAHSASLSDVSLPEATSVRGAA